MSTQTVKRSKQQIANPTNSVRHLLRLPKARRPQLPTRPATRRAPTSAPREGGGRATDQAEAQGHPRRHRPTRRGGIPDRSQRERTILYGPRPKGRDLSSRSYVSLLYIYPNSTKYYGQVGEQNTNITRTYSHPDRGSRHRLLQGPEGVPATQRPDRHLR